MAMIARNFIFIVNAAFVVGMLVFWISENFQYNIMESILVPSGNQMRQVVLNLSSSETSTTEPSTHHAWPSIQQALCGKGYPNLAMSQTLFHFARQEVFGNSAANGTDQPNVTDRINRFAASDDATDFLKTFYDGNYGTSFFYSKTRHLATIYVRIWKCGNNQIRAMEKRLWGEDNVYKFSMDEATDKIYKKNKTDGLFYPRDNKQDTCIYTAVRDPVSHFLSGFNEVVVQQITEGKEVKDYNKLLESSKAERSRQQYFKQLVKDVLLEEDHLTRGVYKHFFPMSRVLSSLHQHGLSLTGYIPTLANLTSTWPEFMSSTCPGFPSLEEIPRMEKKGQHESSKDEIGFYQAAKDVWNEGGDIARALCIIHAFDYACFTDLPDGIPPVCREVFESPAFREAIMKVAGERNYAE